MSPAVSAGLDWRARGREGGEVSRVLVNGSMDYSCLTSRGAKGCAGVSAVSCSVLPRANTSTTSCSSDWDSLRGRP